MPFSKDAHRDAASLRPKIVRPAEHSHLPGSRDGQAATTPEEVPEQDGPK